MWRNGNASVWTPLKYHSSELWWPEFWNHKAIGIRRICNVKTPLKYHSRGLWWTEFWNHKVIGMLRIGNASVWSPLEYIIPVGYGYGHHIPLVWYFNGVQTLALLILHIAIALWVQNCKILPNRAPWKDISMRSKHWHFQFYGIVSSNLQNSGHHRPLEWYFNGVLTLLPILQIPKAL